MDLKEVLEGFGYELKGDLAEVPPSAFQKLLKQIEDKPEEPNAEVADAAVLVLEGRTP